MKHIKRFFAMLLMLTMLLSVFPLGMLNASALEGMGAPTDLTYYAKGVDISYWQAGDSTGKNVNFAKLKASGCEFVILRLAYGQSMDKAFLSFYNNARAAGMPLGVYIYGLKTTRAGAASDAQWAINVFEKYNMYFEYPIFYDIEEADQIALSSANATALCEGWCDTLKAAGYYPGIYSGKQFYNKLTSTFKQNNDLWIAHVASTDVTAWQFTYNYKDYNAQGYSMWQYAWSNLSNGSYIYDGIYSSGTTKVKDLDIDVCYKNYPEIMKTYGYNNCGSDAKAQLLQSIEKARGLRYYSFSENGLSALRSAYDSALSVYNSASSTDTQYKTAKTNLDAAMVSSGTTILSKDCSYTANVTARTEYPDGTKLTDGAKNTSGVATEYGTYAAYYHSGDVEITVDLGASKTSNIFTAYVAKAFWGIPLPNDLKISCSDSKDGTYTSVAGTLTCTPAGYGDTVDGTEVSELYAMTFNAENSVTARYIKFSINVNAYVWVDEVEVASGEKTLDGGVYVTGINEAIGAGDCNIFSSGFGTVTAATANHKWTINAIAEKNSDGNFVVKSVTAGVGDTTPDITLTDDQILIAAHNWETGVTDGTAVLGSETNSARIAGLQVGDVIKLSGIDFSSTDVCGAAPYIEILSSSAEDDSGSSSEHGHTLGAPATCTAAQVCLTCFEVIEEAKGHTEGDWETLEEMKVLRCVDCGYVMRAKKLDSDETVGEEVLLGLRGDVNRNNEIDSRDYVYMKRAYFGTYALDESARLLADVNEDGEFCGSRDYAFLKRAYFNTYKIANPYVYS